MVAVIGRACRKVAPEEALDYVFGYTCGNDVSARHWQRDDVQWWRAKGSDTFTPLGPYIATGLDPANMELRTVVNGEEKQAANTSALDPQPRRPDQLRLAGDDAGARRPRLHRHAGGDADPRGR